MRTIASIWTWTALALLCIGGTFVAALLLLVTLPFDRRRAIPGRFVRLLAVAIAKLNPLWHFRVVRRGDYRPRRTVVVANHVSNSDAFLISHLPWEMKWLAKSSLFFIPFVGWLLWLAGDVAVRRGESRSARGAMARCREYLESGMPVMIFPEGTRSETGELLPFKDGAFRLALEAGADVLPICVAGTRDALPKHSWKFGRSTGLLVVGEPIEGGAFGDVAELKAETRRRIEALREELAQFGQGRLAEAGTEVYRHGARGGASTSMGGRSGADANRKR